LPRCARNRVNTGAYRFTIEQHRARPALGDAAAELGAFDVELIAQGPQQGHFGFDIQGVVFAVDTYFHVQSLLGESFAFDYVVISWLKQPNQNLDGPSAPVVLSLMRRV
jgi:hypothetical protein